VHRRPGGHEEAVARAIQEGTLGDEGGGPAPRAALNAAAIPDPLVESELFGHVRGAFTGATRDRPGRIRSAAGGCFFLDEVGDLPLTAQAKLLRVMETNRVSPVGSDREHEADVRYVAATHQDLGAMVRAGTFRHDLEQRLAGVVIGLPPLRERPDDIADIGNGFVAHELAGEHHVPDRHRIARWLESAEPLRYAWPGNVRELESALRNMMLGLLPNLAPHRSSTAADRQQMESELPAAILAGAATLSEASDWYLERVLAAQGGNLACAARVLDVDRSTVKRRALRSRRPRG
jgi:transcriptional regulator with GAF, ATPase, and Fis domain